MDPFATAKANLRDTIKWLTTVFAAIVGVVLAGSPLTGLGTLPIGWRLAVALVGAAIGLMGLVLAIGRTLALLQSKVFFLEDLRRNEQLCALVDANAIDLLPPEYGTALSFLDARKAIRERLADLTLSKEDRAVAVSIYQQFDQVAFRLTNFLHFEVLSIELSAAIPGLFRLALASIIGLGIFAWAANPPKPASDAHAQYAVL